MAKEEVNWEAVRGYVEAGKYEQLLAALGYYPFTGRFSEAEIESFRSELGLTKATASLGSIITSFIMDVLLPPPFRPPLALILNIIGSA